MTGWTSGVTKVERMEDKSLDRRAILRTLGASGALVALPKAAMGGAQLESPTQEVLQPEPESKPMHSIRFGVCGMSHDHIYGMVKAVERGGGQLVAAWGAEADKLATFTKRYPNVKRVQDQDAILDDRSEEHTSELQSRP